MLLRRAYFEGTQLAVRTDHDLHEWISYLSDASRRLARWQTRLTKLDFDVAHRPAVKHKAADALARLRTDGKETTNLGEDLSMCNAENTQETDEEMLYVHVCTEGNVGKEPITGKPDEDSMKKEDPSASTVQRTERQTTREEV